MNFDKDIAQQRENLEQMLRELTVQVEGIRDRRRGAINSQIHKVLRLLEVYGEFAPRRGPGPFFSEHGQDRCVNNALKDKTQGVFVDIGGYDGVLGSNTLFFEQFRNWQGILIEPSASRLAAARAARRCTCIQAALGSSEGNAEFLEVVEGFTQMSGFLDTYDPALLDMVQSDPRFNGNTYTLPRRTLAGLLREYRLSRVDYISLDIEGGEIPVLESFPFNEFDIHYWSIENNKREDRIFEIMSENNYDLLEYAGQDEIYVKKSS